MKGRAAHHPSFVVYVPSCAAATMGNNHPKAHQPIEGAEFPHFNHFVETAPGCWDLRTDFDVGPVNIGTHMSILKLPSRPGHFVSIDAAELSADAKRELDELTQNGERLVGCLHTHPFHTLAIPAFHAAYPATDNRSFFGCPRHLRNFPDINWSGDLNDEANLAMFEPDVYMKVPPAEATEFVDPKPPTRNHFANVFVFHPSSKTMIQADTLCFFRDPVCAYVLVRWWCLWKAEL